MSVRRAPWAALPIAPAKSWARGEERATVERAIEVLERAWEGGAFDGIEAATRLGWLDRAARRSEEVLGSEEGVEVVARDTSVGSYLIVGLRERAP